MKCCNQPMSDFSSGAFTDTPHFYCKKCNAHFYVDKWYTAEEWFFYINGVSFNEYHKQLREQEMMEDGQRLHAHEIINHSDPE